MVGYTPGMPPAHAPVLDLATRFSVLLVSLRKVFCDEAGASPGANDELRQSVSSSRSYVMGMHMPPSWLPTGAYTPGGAGPGCHYHAPASAPGPSYYETGASFD